MTPSKDLPDGLPNPQRLWATFSVTIAILMAVLDASIANIALPTIARDLNVSASDSIWVVNAYQLALIMSILPASSLGDIFGHRRVFKIGLALFTVASLACALSPGLLVLTVSRVIQGFGAAGIMGVNIAMIRFIYPRAMIARGLGFSAFVVACSSAGGPSVASAVLSVASWPWLFAINLPVGFVALFVMGRFLPAPKGSGNPFDWTSAILSSATFGLLVIGLEGIAHGQELWQAGLELLGAAILGTLLIRRELKRPAPLLAVDLFRIPVFSLSVLTSLLCFTAQGIGMVALPFYFEGALGRSQVESGFLITPWALTVGLLSPLMGRLSERYPAGVLCTVGMSVMTVGLLSLALVPLDASSLDIAFRVTLCGLGFGLYQTPNNRLVQTSAPRERAGGANGIGSSTRVLGQTTGAALVALVFTFLPPVAGEPGHSGSIALFIATGLAITGGIVSSLRLADFSKARPPQG